MGYKVPYHVNTQEDSGTANTGSLTITKPVGLAVDHLMLAFFSVNVQTITPPSGWTQYDSDQPGTNAFTGQVFYKVADASDVAASNFNFTVSSTASPFCGAISAYADVDTTNPIHAAAQTLGTTANPVTTPSVDITVPCLVVHSRCVRENSTTQITFTGPGGYTERQEFGNNGATVSYAGCSYDNGTISLSGTITGISITGSSAPTDSVSRSIALTAATLTDGTDTGSGTESQSLAVTTSDADTSSGAEASTLSVTTSDADTGSGVEDSSISATLSSPDTGSGAEAESVSVAVSSSDTGSSVEAESLAVTLSSADTGSGVDDGSVDAGGTTPSSSDTGSAAEDSSIVVTLSDSDTASAVEAGSVPGDEEGPQLGDYIVTLVMGPASVYVADYGTLEPTDTGTLLGSYSDLGTTLDGVQLTVKHEYESPVLVQEVHKPSSRLKRRHLSVKCSLAEPTLTSLLYALDHGSIVAGAGYESYSAPLIDRATPLTYRVVIIDGWAPDFNPNNQHKRRRLILRRCLSTQGAEMSYNKDKLTVYGLQWDVHRVDDSTAPFKIIDEV